MSSAPDPPTLYEGTVGEATLRQLFADLAGCAEVVEVRLKGAERAEARETTTLGRAHQLLEAGAVRGVQITYRYEDVVWQDTLLSEGAGQPVRIVRVARTDLA